LRAGFLALLMAAAPGSGHAAEGPAPLSKPDSIVDKARATRPPPPGARRGAGGGQRPVRRNGPARAAPIKAAAVEAHESAPSRS
jgi:hypothetical protein